MMIVVNAKSRPTILNSAWVCLGPGPIWDTCVHVDADVYAHKNADTQNRVFRAIQKAPCMRGMRWKY